MQREFLNYKNRYFIILNRIQTHNSQINGLILTKYPVLFVSLYMILGKREATVFTITAENLL